jgi:hypothetical protein
MATFSDRTASSVIGVPALNNDTNDFSWAGGSTNAGNVIPPTPETNLVKRFVILNIEGNYSYSTDASSWTQPTTIPQSNFVSWSDIVYANEKFVAVGRTSCAYSTNGLDWTAGNIEALSYDRRIAYGNGKFVAITQGQDTKEVFISTDGVSWEKTSYNLWTNYGRWSGLTFGNGIFIAVESGYNQIAVSEDGLSWTNSYPSIGSEQKTNIAYGNGKFVFLSRNTTRAYSSVDGTSWTSFNEANVLPVQAGWQSVTYGNGTFVAVALSNSSFMSTDIAIYSTDGITWTQSNLPLNSNWRRVTYGNGRFVAIGSDPTAVAYSTDGITWTQSTLSLETVSSSIAYGEWQQVVI